MKPKQNLKYTEATKAFQNILNTDYDSLIHKDIEGISYYNKTPLLSFSSALNGLNKIKYCTIPKWALHTAQSMGQEVTTKIQEIVEHKVSSTDIETKIEFSSEKLKCIVIALYKKLQELNMKVVTVEKHITNGYWHGYIDLIVKDKNTRLYTIIEIKTRNSDEVLAADKAQAALYAKMIHSTHIPTYVLVINKKNFNITMEKVNVRIALKPLIAFVEAFGDKNYLKGLKKEI